jgi:hypothetical protein
MSKKKYTLKIDNDRRGSRTVTGTLEELTRDFGYTLEVGRSWDRRVNVSPKNIRSFVSNLQRAYEAKEARIYTRTFVSLVADQPTENRQ